MLRTQLRGYYIEKLGGNMMIVIFITWFLIVMGLFYIGFYIIFKIDMKFNLEKIYSIIENKLL